MSSIGLILLVAVEVLVCRIIVPGLQSEECSIA